MKIQINISVRNPDWYWKEDDYQKEWILINEEKTPKYSPAVTFEIDADVQEYVKADGDQYTFRFINSDQSESQNPDIQEVLVKGLDVTEFFYADGKTPVIISKSILNNVMAAQNQVKGKFYWYYFIKEEADYIEFRRNIWLSREHFEELKIEVPNLSPFTELP